MAEASIIIKEDEFCCSICLDLLTAPVTLACGHSFCISCITSSFDQSPGIYSCPQCRESFVTRPNLRRNNMLAGVVDKLKQPRLQVSYQCSAKSGDVECDLCTGIKCKAVKSCLVCLASYCEDHFQPHKESSALMTHTVIEASAKLLEKICPQHGRPLDVFCRTDQKCICYLCTLDEHSSHNVVSAVAERAEKEKQVMETKNNYTHRILERDGDRKELVKILELTKHSAQVAVDDTEKLFRELIQSIEKKCSEVTNQIRAQENDEVNRTREHLKQVEQEIVELKSKNEELKQLSQTKENILFFQIFQSFGDLSLSETIPRVNINMPHLYEAVKIFVHKLQEKIKSTKWYPDSASQINSHQMTSRSSQTACHPKQNTLISSNTVPSFCNPATIWQTTSRPDTQSPPVSAFFRTSDTQSPPVSAFFRTSDTQAQPVSAFFRTSDTQAQPVPGFLRTPDTQSPPVSAFFRTSDTQAQPVPGFLITPDTLSPPVSAFFRTSDTQAQPVPGFFTTHTTQFPFVSSSFTTPVTQSSPVSGFFSTPATQSKNVFRY